MEIDNNKKSDNGQRKVRRRNPLGSDPDFTKRYSKYIKQLKYRNVSLRSILVGLRFDIKEKDFDQVMIYLK